LQLLGFALSRELNFAAGDLGLWCDQRPTIIEVWSPGQKCLFGSFECSKLLRIFRRRMKSALQGCGRQKPFLSYSKWFGPWPYHDLFAALIETGQQKDGFGATAGKNLLPYFGAEQIR